MIQRPSTTMVAMPAPPASSAMEVGCPSTVTSPVAQAVQPSSIMIERMQTATMTGVMRRRMASPMDSR
jgi:hypothetical protein